jgi:hypothetical protein
METFLNIVQLALAVGAQLDVAPRPPIDAIRTRAR